MKYDFWQYIPAYFVKNNYNIICKYFIAWFYFLISRIQVWRIYNVIVLKLPTSWKLVKLRIKKMMMLSLYCSIVSKLCKMQCEQECRDEAIFAQWYVRNHHGWDHVLTWPGHIRNFRHVTHGFLDIWNLDQGSKVGLWFIHQMITNVIFVWKFSLYV